MKTLLSLQIIFIFFISSCASDKLADSDGIEMPGSDRDIHGCIGSAGYSWCERTGQCERPWELAERAGFDNTQVNFKAYCTE
ncbi:MAG TPA: serine protease [Gammaproteobacteria bacterium]|jgi:hypothetical protein|nr:serine protease [Gammaproteobacteria bacterium]